MTLSTFLQAVISLVFIYLILSLLTSELQEYLATFSEARAKRLKQSIRKMLGEEDWLNGYFIDSKNIKVYPHESEIPKKSIVWLNLNDETFTLTKNTEFKFDDNDNSLNFTWIDAKNNTELDAKNNTELDAKLSDSKKYPLYQVLIELKKDTEYYIDTKNQRIVSPPHSLTEELYKHPNIEALNQSAFRWFWILGISFDYPFKPWKDFKTLNDFNIVSGEFWKDFKKEDYFNLLSTALLIISVSCLFFSQILFAFIFFIFFAISRLLSFFSKGEKGKVGSRRESLGPSYIDDSELFAKTLIDVIYGNSSNIDDNNSKKGLKKTVNSLKFYTPASSRLVERLEKSADITDLTTFSKDLQKQYEEVQKRSTGVYKRNAKGLSFIVGLLIAISFNADTFNMISNLTKENNNFSNQLISNLEKDPTLLQCPPGTPENQSCLDETKQNQLKSLIDNTGTFPLGWDYNEKLNLQEQEQKIQNNYNLIQKLEGGDERTIYNYCVQDDIENIKHQDCFDKVEKVLIDNNNTDILPYLSPEFKSNVKEGVKDAKNIYSFPKTYRVFINEKKKELASLLVDKKLNTVPNTISIEQIKNTVDNTVQKQGGWFKVPFGWLITAIALSMGAPFWFDQLDRIMNVRNSAKPKDQEDQGQNENTSK